jgi:shikimate kinase
VTRDPAPLPERIVLVGFMAAGKTTAGRRLADRLGWRFVDFDAALERRTGLAPGTLIREHGEARLRREEARLTDELAGCRRTVLAPGGGWITQPELVARLGPGTALVWLRLPAAEAVRRAEAERAPGTGTSTERGAVNDDGADELEDADRGEGLQGAQGLERPEGAKEVDRPLLGPREGRVERAEALLRRREPLYAAADVVVDVDGLEPDAVVDEILRRLRTHREDDER